MIFLEERKKFLRMAPFGLVIIFHHVRVFFCLYGRATLWRSCVGSLCGCQRGRKNHRQNPKFSRSYHDRLVLRAAKFMAKCRIVPAWYLFIGFTSMLGIICTGDQYLSRC